VSFFVSGSSGLGGRECRFAGEDPGEQVNPVR
jgi:hypothetical protein